jgi:hypothetical protein
LWKSLIETIGRLRNKEEEWNEDVRKFINGNVYCAYYKSTAVSDVCATSTAGGVCATASDVCAAASDQSAVGSSLSGHGTSSCDKYCELLCITQTFIYNYLQD